MPPKKPKHELITSDAERLRATPFTTIEELEAAELVVRQEVWLRITKARIAHELLSKEEFAAMIEAMRKSRERK